MRTNVVDLVLQFGAEFHSRPIRKVQRRFKIARASILHCDAAHLFTAADKLLKTPVRLCVVATPGHALERKIA